VSTNVNKSAKVQQYALEKITETVTFFKYWIGHDFLHDFLLNVLQKLNFPGYVQDTIGNHALSCDSGNSIFIPVMHNYKNFTSVVR